MRPSAERRGIRARRVELERERRTVGRRRRRRQRSRSMLLLMAMPRRRSATGTPRPPAVTAGGSRGRVPGSAVAPGGRIRPLASINCDDTPGRRHPLAPVTQDDDPAHAGSHGTAVTSAQVRRARGAELGELRGLLGRGERADARALLDVVGREHPAALVQRRDHVAAVVRARAGRPRSPGRAAARRSRRAARRCPRRCARRRRSRVGSRPRSTSRSSVVDEVGLVEDDDLGDVAGADLADDVAHGGELAGRVGMRARRRRAR